MQTEARKLEVNRYAFISKFSVLALTLCVGLLSQQVSATTGDTQYRQFITDLCGGFITPPSGVVWDTATLSQMCTDAASGFIGSGGVAIANVSTSGAGGSLASHKKKGIAELNDKQKDKPAKGASADGGGWGLLVAPQYGKGNRLGTDLENGYQSDLKGLVIGVDYRFSDDFVLGLAVGQTKDEATFLDSAGFLKTSSNTATIYGTWLASEKSSIDGYLGYGKLNIDNQRKVTFGVISGVTGGSTTGQQIMAGMSTSYQINVDRFDLAPFISIDYIKTDINAFSETGTTTMELHYSDRSTTSLISGVGAQILTSYGFDWGTLTPYGRLAAVHEFKNNVKQISNELVSAPGVGITVSTDAPDRNYLNVGLGVSAALNSGAQLFIDYDKRARDRLLSSWAISLGVLMEY